jgi:hypothetical protein
MLLGYFDGSGKSEVSEYLTLTGLIASESVWDRFERSWNEILQKYHISVFHMSEAMSLNNRFSVRNGWNREKVRAVVNDLWNVFGRYLWTKDLSLKSNLYARSCTVVMRDYRRAKSENPRLREPEALCTGFCCHRLPFDLDSNLEHPEIALVFDRGEPFLNTIYRGWVKYKHRPDAGWPKQIKEIRFAEANQCPLIQAADLVAWTINKYHRRPDGYPDADAFAASIMVSHETKTFDYDAIMKTPRSLICS